jgi:hypothetical protein
MFNLKSKKGLSTPEYMFGTISTILLLIMVVLLFNLFMSSCSTDKTIFMREKSISNLHKESLYLFLISPVKFDHPIHPFYETDFFYLNNQVLRKYSLPLDLSQEGIKFEINISDINSINNLNLPLRPGRDSNIALIYGSVDHILPYLEQELIFPDIISWDELSNNHDYVFAGCSSPLPKDKNKVLNWISNGGTLITTDYSIEIIQQLFGNEYVYSNKISIRNEPIEIEFTPLANEILGLSGKLNVKDIYWTDINNNSILLANYNSLSDYEPCKKTKHGCGAPIHMFSHGQGKIIHFSFHLDQNEDILMSLFDKIVNQNNFVKFDDPNKFEIYNESGYKLVEYNNSLFIAMNILDDLNLLNQFSNCKNNCSKTFIIKGDGRLLLRPVIKEISTFSIYSYDEISLLDFMVYALSTNNEKNIKDLKNYIETYLNDLSNDVFAHKITISKLPDKEQEIFHVISKKYSDNWFNSETIKVEAEQEFKLYTGDSFYITLESGLRTKSVIGTAIVTFKTISPFLLFGGPI